MRRTIIALAATVVAAQAAVTVSAQISADEENIFRYRTGNFEVIVLTQGQGEGDTGILLDAPAEVTESYLSENGTYPTATNVVLIRNGDHIWLIDAGYGATLFDTLEALGLGSRDVDRVLLTHMHGDHIGGLLKDGARAFDAPLGLSATEAGYWAGQEGSAKTVLDLYKPETLELYRLGEAPLGREGIFPVEAFGHTPGHTAFLVVSGDEKLMIWGDIAHAMAVQMPHPEISVRYDVDPDAARVSRLEILEYVVANNIPVAGMHIPYPGIGIVEKAGQGYKFTPITQ